MNLQEKYRPQSFGDIVGQEKAVQALQFIGRNGWGGKALWIAGPSGCGKTTLARIVAQEHVEGGIVTEYESADRFGQSDVDMILDASRVRGFMNQAFIINESHAMRAGIMRQLLGIMENLPAHLCLVFTTTLEGESDMFEGQKEKELVPWFRRVSKVQLARRLEKGSLADLYAERCLFIAKAEGIDGGKDISFFKKLMQDCGNSLGLALQKVDMGISVL